MNAAVAIVALVALQRLVEVAHAARNTRALRRRGAIEHGRRHYPVIVVLHVLWLGTLAVLAWHGARLAAVPLALFVLLQLLRLWVIHSLGSAWTTRVLTLAERPLVRSGPYRWLRHPNYLVVALEIPLLLLAFDAPGLAIAFGVANVLLIAWRIRVEEAALAPLRARG
jgi:methyltransferase